MCARSSSWLSFLAVARAPTVFAWEHLARSTDSGTDSINKTFYTCLNCCRGQLPT